MSKMLQAVFHGPKDLRLETVARPQPGAEEVLVKINVALTCGTDLKCFRRGHPVLLNHRLPSPLGHEFAGTIEAVGKNVTKFSVGDSVVAANSAPCGKCYFCKRGETNLCDHLELLNGAYAEAIVIPEAIVRGNLHRLPKDLSFRAAALTEPLACVVRAFERLDLQKGDRLAIHGCGLMGLFFVALAKARGIKVMAIGRSLEKLEKAKTLGADEVLSTEKEKKVVEKVRAWSDGRGADAVVEAIGQSETWQEAIAMARKGGQVCLYGGCAPGATLTLDAHRVHYEELRVFGSFHHTPKHFAQALDLLSQNFLPIDLFIQGEIPLRDIAKHFSATHDKPFHKIAVLPEK